MPNSYTQVFGGNTIYPSDVSYLALTLTANITLEWPLEASTGNNVVARILDVTSNGAFSISMPNATQTGVGQTILFNNVAATTFTVKSYTGTTLISIPSGTQWELYLTDNTTTTGTWRAFQFGAATTSAQAAALAGYGLVAQGATLAQSEPVTVFNTSYTFGAADRAGAYVWDGGLGTVTLPAASTAGNDWFVSLRNDGTGNLTLTAAGSDLINGAATLVLRPADSATVVTDGVSFWTIGLGQDPVFAFDYTSISITSQTSPYTLSGAELNRIAYQFVGVLTANMVVYVPATTQQYWVANDTTGGSFTLSVGTSTQAAPLTVTRGARGIYYCDGTSVIKADTASIAVPIAVSDGGTGATTASGARVNLGGTSVGIAVFTAATTAAAQTAIGLTVPFTAAQGGTGLTASGTVGNVLTSTGSAWVSSAPVAGGTVTSVGVGGGTTGLTTSGGPVTTSGTITLAGTLIPANGGTGQTSYTNGELLIGNTTGNTLTKASLTAGSGISITPGSGSITIAATGAGTVTSITAGTGLTGGAITTSGTIALDYTAASPWTGKQTFTGSTSVLAAKFVNALETATISAIAATGTINYDITTQSVLYYTTNASANWTTNLRASSGTTLNTAMATGESITAAFLVTQGATAYYNNVVQVDGTTVGVTTKWQSAVPTAGNASGIDVYTYTVIKTGAATFTVLASVTPFV